jgi:hypothetical protein
MEEASLSSICANLSKGQPIKVQTAIGRNIIGYFISYESSEVIGILMLSNNQNTLCLPSNQINRIFLYDDENEEDTLSPQSLD